MTTNSNTAIGLLFVSVLLACVSFYMSGSPGPLSGLKSTGTCTGSFNCVNDFDKDLFFSACVWIGFCCKCLGLLTAMVYKCKTEEESGSCQAISSTLTLISALCYVVEFVDIIAHLSVWGHWEYQGGDEVTTSEIIAGLDLCLDSLSFLGLVAAARGKTTEYRYGRLNNEIN